MKDDDLNKNSEKDIELNSELEQSESSSIIPKFLAVKLTTSEADMTESDEIDLLENNQVDGDYVDGHSESDGQYQDETSSLDQDEELDHAGHEIDAETDTSSQQSDDDRNQKGFVQDGSNNAFKLAFVGGRSVGKTYLFQALVNTLAYSENTGALSYFIDTKNPVDLFRRVEGQSRFGITNIDDYLRGFNNWDRLLGTTIGYQHSYQLRVPFKDGVLANNKRSMYIEYFDGAGEQLVSGSDQGEKTWLTHYHDAEVMVFCLPFWAAFPSKDHQDSSPKSDEYRLELEETISSFVDVVQNYNGMRNLHNIDTKVKCVVALTQADQSRFTTFGQELAETWMYPFLRPPEVEEDEFQESVQEYMKNFRSGAGVNRYLANARNLSDLLREEVKKNKTINRALKYLDYGCGEPWLIPMSAISGELLDGSEVGSPPQHEPVSAHIELPLLVALSQYCNALM